MVSWSKDKVATLARTCSASGEQEMIAVFGWDKRIWRITNFHKKPHKVFIFMFIKVPDILKNALKTTMTSNSSPIKLAKMLMSLG